MLIGQIATGRRLAALAGYMACAGMLAGCPAAPRPVPVGIETLVAERNAVASAVPRLWARVERLTVKPAGVPLSWDFTGTLLLAKGPEPLGPHDFVLIGREAGQDVFRVGTSRTDQVYYYWARLGEQAGGAVGHLALAGAPGLDELPIDPMQLLSVLTVTAMPSDLTQIPAVALTMSDDPPAYVVTYIDRQPISGRILFRREVYLPWAFDQPRRPYMVKVLDNQGRRVMTAHLSDYQPIDTSTMLDPPALTPEMPTDIRIQLHPRREALEAGGEVSDQGDVAGQIESIRIRLADMQAETNDDDESRWDRAATLLWERLPANLPRQSLRRIDSHLSTPTGAGL